MAKGNIIVIKPNADFEQVPGKVIRECSPEVIGVYCKLLTFGEEWSLNIKGLSTCLSISQDRVRKAINILEGMGYIVRRAIHENGRLQGWDYIIYGNAVDESERSHAGFSLDEIQTCPKLDNTENGQDNINILEDNKHTDIDKHINKTTNNNTGATRFVKPSLDEVKAYCDERLSKVDPEQFFAYYEANGWKVGKNPMKDWKAAFRYWEKSEKERKEKVAPKRKESTFEKNLRTIDEMMGTNYHEQYYGNK